MTKLKKQANSIIDARNELTKIREQSDMVPIAVKLYFEDGESGKIDLSINYRACCVDVSKLYLSLIQDCQDDIDKKVNKLIEMANETN